MQGANDRLTAVISLIAVGDKVADIGCDHGKVAVYAAKFTGNTTYATDISAPSLKKAEALAEERGLADKIICLSGDGLKPVEGCDINTIVIAGMGGMEIIKILSEANVRYDKYILVPHRDAKALRQYLMNNGYGVKTDRIVAENGKYYAVICAEGRGKCSYSPFEAYFGKKDDAFRREYSAHRLQYLHSLLPKASGGGRAEIEAEISAIEENDENK